MAEEDVELDFGDVNPKVADSEFDLIVSDEPDAEVPVFDPKVYEAQLAALKAEKEELAKRADSTAQMGNAFNAFAEQLKAQQRPVQQAPSPQPTVDWQALEQTVNNQTFKNPFQGITAAVAPGMNYLNSEISALKLQHKLIDSKLALSADSELAGVYGKYKGEVDELVSRGGVDYVAATKAVQTNHVADIVKEAVAKALAEAQISNPPSPTVTKSQPTVTHSGNLSSAAAKAEVNNKPKVSARVYQSMRQKAMDWAMNPDDKDDMEYVYNTFKSAGMLNG